MRKEIRILRNTPISSLFQPKMVFSDLGETLIEIRMLLAY